MIDVKAAFMIAAGQGVTYDSHDLSRGILVVNYSVGEGAYQAQAKAKNGTSLAVANVVKACAKDARETAYVVFGGLAADIADAKQRAGLEMDDGH